MKIICDKCQSSRIETFTKEQPKEPAPITMREAVKRSSDPMISTLEMRYTTMVMLCKDCGYRLEYTV